MDALVGFHIGFWDYVTFASLFIIGAAFLGRRRAHPRPSGSHRHCTQAPGG